MSEGIAGPSISAESLDRGFWTEERMLSARPMPLPPIPSPPAHTRSRSSRFMPRSPGLRHDILGMPPPSPAPLDFEFFTDRVQTPAIYPYVSIGKLFFMMGNIAYVGSAAACQMNGIIAAGHILYDPKTQTWASNIWFAPAYSPAGAPYGMWPVLQAFAQIQWIQQGKYDFDLGFARMGPGNPSNLPLGARVGYLGLAINPVIDHQTAWDDVGYPYTPLPNYPFDGKTMWSCLSVFLRYNDTQDSVVKADNFTQGASGSPWL